MKNYNKDKTEFIKNKFNGFLDGNILDIGCNESVVASSLSLNKKDYLGIDIDTDALAIARKKGYQTKKLDLSKGKINLNENSFDSFLCLDLLEHVLEPRKIISEIKRVIVPSGKGIIALPNDLNLSNILKVLFTKISLVTRDTLWSPIGHLPFPSVKESLDLTKSNFVVKEVYYLPTEYTVPFLPYRLKKILANLIPKFFAQTIIFKVKNTKKF
jgi:SAM-dependent methyltransferase